jgi:3-dehydroquinate dehydratase-2
LNLLGTREPEIYGSKSLEDIDAQLVDLGHTLGVQVKSIQTNHEGGLIDAIHDAQNWADAIIINPGAYTHTSIAIRDAISAVHLPTVEIHLSNTTAREPFRKESLIAPVCVGIVSGFGWRSYELGLRAVAGFLS